jgi:hypothetical protein
MKIPVYLLAAIAAIALSLSQTAHVAQASEAAPVKEMIVTVKRLPNGTTVTNYDVAGAAKVNRNIRCIAPDKLTNKLTPAELYPVHEKCITVDDYKEATLIYALAGVYVEFDKLRVADETAHDAGELVRSQSNFIPTPEQAVAAMKAISEASNDPQAVRATCAQIKKIGPPNYFPDYMFAYGLEALNGKPKRLVTPFDAAAAWKSSLDSYLHCPQD